MSDAAQEQIVMTTLFQSKDELDTEIMDKTISMIIGLDLNNLIFNDKITHDKYFSYVMNIAESLFKANSHKRKYIEQHTTTLINLRIKYQNNANLTDEAIHLVELDSEIDAVLTQLKSALDSLAKTFNPLFMFKLDGWHAVKKESGRQIVSALRRNLPNNLKERAKNLIDYIEINILPLSYLVFLRNQPNHHGGLNNITDIMYKHKNKEFVPQFILHGPQSEKVENFLARIIKDITVFIHSVIVLSLLVKAPPQFMIYLNDKEKFPPYRWGINI